MDGEDHVFAGAMKNKTMAMDFVPDAAKIGLHADQAEPGNASNKQGDLSQ